MSNTPTTITIEQASEMLFCSPEVMAERLKNGELPGIKYGRSWVIPFEAFMARLNEIALENAEQRRQELSRGQRTAALPKPVMSATPGQRGRLRRVPPLLPTH